MIRRWYSTGHLANLIAIALIFLIALAPVIAEFFS